MEQKPHTGPRGGGQEVKGLLSQVRGRVEADLLSDLIRVLMVRVAPSHIFGFCKESFCSDTHGAEWRLTHVPQEDEDEDEDEETDARL